MTERTSQKHIVQRLRIKLGWTQEKLAEVSGVSPRTVQRVESGQIVGFESLRMIAAALDVDLDEIRGSKGDAKPERRRLVRLNRAYGGRELLGVISGADIYNPDHDELTTEEEATAVGDFLQTLHDLHLLGTDIEPRDWTMMEHHVGTALSDLDSDGFRVFAAKYKQKVTVTNKLTGETSPWNTNIAVVLVLRNKNPRIVRGRDNRHFVALDTSTRQLKTIRETTSASGNGTDRRA